MRAIFVSFNLVIERLLISGEPFTLPVEPDDVSISLSSGFSFQVKREERVATRAVEFQSRYRAASHFRGKPLTASQKKEQVSISLSSGFSFQDRILPVHRWHPGKFQSRYRAASHFRFNQARCINACSKFQSRYRAASHFRQTVCCACVRLHHVSISLSSGFSFQVPTLHPALPPPHVRFNLVIERLLISGLSPAATLTPQSLMFQSRYRAASHFRKEGRITELQGETFQSRYRAAFHFRSVPAEPLIRFG